MTMDYTVLLSIFLFCPRELRNFSIANLICECIFFKTSLFYFVSIIYFNATNPLKQDSKSNSGISHTYLFLKTWYLQSGKVTDSLPFPITTAEPVIVLRVSLTTSVLYTMTVSPAPGE